jgi:hypothetical protein
MRLWMSASLMVALLATLALDAYVRGGSVAAVVGAIPWVGVAVALLVAGVLYRAATAVPSPEVLAVLDQVAKDRAICRYCAGPLGANDITCRSCQRVVWHTGTAAGALLGGAITVGLFILVAWRALAR